MAAVTTFSRTASNNNSAAPDGWPEGQSAASVNNCARELMKCIVDEATNNACKVLASVAGTNTITGTLTPDLAAYSPGMLVVATPAVTNTGATTLNIDGLGAIAVQNIDGTACVGGELVVGIPALLLLNSGATAWIIQAPGNSLDIRQNVQTANYTLAISDRGKHIISTSGGNKTFTIPANSVVAFPIGTVITIISLNDANSVAINTDSLFWVNGGATIPSGNRTLSINAIVNLVKIQTTGWIISGSGIS